MLYGTVAAGILMGAVGAVLPILAGNNKAMRLRNLSIQVSIVALGFSLIVMFLALLVCSRVAQDYLAAFAIALIATFLVITVIYAVVDVVRKSRP